MKRSTKRAKTRSKIEIYLFSSGLSLQEPLRLLQTTVGQGISPCRHAKRVSGLYHRYGISPIPKNKFDSIKFVSKINYAAVYQNDKRVLKVPRSAINFKEFIPAAKEYYKQHNIDKKKHIKYIWHGFNFRKGIAENFPQSLF